MKELADLRNFVESQGQGAFEAGIVNQIIDLITEHPGIVLEFMGAFTPTALRVHQWTKEAASDGDVTMKEAAVIFARGSATGVGIALSEMAFARDPGTAMAAMTLVAAEFGLGYSLLQDATLLDPRKASIKTKEYWARVLRMGAKALGVAVVCPKLGVALFALNPVDFGMAASGTGLVVMANLDLVKEWLGKKH